MVKILKQSILEVFKDYDANTRSWEEFLPSRRMLP